MLWTLDTLALLAGMAAAFSPCGVAMLPSYFVLVAGDRSGSALRNGLRTGIAMSAGFVVVFALAALVLAGVRMAFTPYLPYVGLLLGIALAIWGGFALFRPHLLSIFSFSSHGGLTGRRLAVFGGAYAIACLSCALPIFLSLTLQAIAAPSTFAVLTVVGLYALGMAVVTTAVAILALGVGAGFQRWLLGALPTVTRASAAVVVLSGVYLALYWLHGLQVAI